MTIHEWYDGPRTGAAEYEGKPYWYRSLYLDTIEWNPDEDRFDLTPLTPEVLQWELDRTAIFQRWDAARKAGQVPTGDEADPLLFGASPSERELYATLNRQVEAFVAGNHPTLLARGTFELGCENVTWRSVTTAS